MFLPSSLAYLTALHTTKGKEQNLILLGAQHGAIGKCYVKRISQPCFIQQNIYICKINLTLVTKKGRPLRIGKRILTERFGEKSFGISRKNNIFLYFPSESIRKISPLLKISACVKFSSEVDLKVITQIIASFNMLSVSKKYFRLSYFVTEFHSIEKLQFLYTIDYIYQQVL